MLYVLVSIYRTLYLSNFVRQKRASPFFATLTTVAAGGEALSLHFSVVMAETSRACLGFPSLHHSAMIEDPQQLLGQATFWNGPGWSTKQHKQWRLAYHVRRRSLRNQTDLTFQRKWPIIGRGGERTVRPDEVRGAFSGIVLIGDSVMREVAWSVTQMMNEGRRRERARSSL